MKKYGVYFANWEADYFEKDFDSYEEAEAYAIKRSDEDLTVEEYYYVEDMEKGIILKEFA